MRFDREVDHEMPRRLVCFRPNGGGPWEIRREMRPDERVTLDARCAALEIATSAYEEAETASVEASIGAMLGGFRSMRQQGENVVRIIEITRAVLREFPAWAINRACLKIARHETKHDPRFAPNDAELADQVRAVLKPYREALDAARALLGSAVRTEPEPHARGSVRKAKPFAPERGDGKHASRIASDLEARKARNAMREGAAGDV